MKIPYRQLKRFGCSFYTLANLFDEPKYLEYMIEDRGGYLETMNKAVRELLPGFFISPLFMVLSGLEVQNRFYDVSFFSMKWELLSPEAIESGFRPFIVSIKMPISHHAILVLQNFRNGMLYVFNSLREESECYSVEEFVLKFWVTELCVFESESIIEACTWGAPGEFLWFNYNYFPHLKPE